MVAKIYELKASDFKDRKPWLLKNTRCSFILFKAEWCGYCRDFKPVYEILARKLPCFRLYIVDIDSNEELIKKITGPKSPLKVKGYPTIWAYKNGKPLREIQSRTELELIADAIKICGSNCKCNE